VAEPFKILYVSTSTTLGGAEKTLFTLATLIDPKLCQVAGVVSLKPKGAYADKLERAGTPVYSLNVKSRAGLQDIQKLALVVHETRPDLVHAIMYQGIQLCRAVRRLGYAEFKLISSPRVNYRSRGGVSLMIDRFLKSADDLLITECAASRRYLTESLGYPENGVLTIYNGVDIAGWPISKPDRTKLRKELGVADNEILLGSVGRLDEQKGHLTLLETLSRLRTVHPVKCAVIGEGPLRKFLEEKIAMLRLQDCVRLLGEQKDIPGWLAAMDIFVLPSLWEGLPNALLEAMALGLPVVATRVDGVPEAIAHDISGLLCEPNDPQSLYVPVSDMIIDENLRKRLGEGAKKVITENFRLSDMIQNYQNAYQKVMGVPQQEG